MEQTEGTIQFWAKWHNTVLNISKMFSHKTVTHAKVTKKGNCQDTYWSVSRIEIMESL